jgi:simple sugar transport system permease protein
VQRTVQLVLVTLLSVAAAMLVALVVVAALRRNPFAVLQGLIGGPLGDPYRFAESLGQSCPLILCGLAVAVAFRCQAWNIGVEGQYLMGAIVAAWLGVTFTELSGRLLIPAILIGSAGGGALYALPPVWLESKRHVPLVLSTILLNFVALSILQWLTMGPLAGADKSAPQTDPIAEQAELGALVRGTDFHWGWLLAVGCGVVLWVMLKWTRSGFAIRAAGLNPVASRWAGIRVDAVKTRTMCLSGALGGLAGGVQVAGVHHFLGINASEEFGYVGIAVALLGRLHPLGVIVAAVFIGMLDIGAFELEKSATLRIPSDLAEVIKGVLILSVLVFSGPRIGRWLRRRRATA